MRPPTVAASVLVTAAVLAVGWHEGARAGQASPAGVHVVAAPPPAAPGPAAGAASASGSTRGSKKSHRGSRTTGTGPGDTPAKAAQAGSPLIQDGAVVATPYGDVQVSVVTVGHRITDVRALRLTDANGHSRRISADAAPILRREALTAQSASIDAVSGATYTSEGYKQSLQAALDQAHL